ncbi:MAG: hypothetical protein ACTHL8_20005 [Burkholderiaceae bacterium]
MAYERLAGTCQMSAQPPIDDEVRRFVLASIPSVSYLEAALLFRRQPKPRNVAETARALYVSDKVAAEILASLSAAGVLAGDGDVFDYAPRDEALAAMLDRLAGAYSADLVGVTNLIHDKTHRNARRFADAFRLRKDS